MPTPRSRRRKAEDAEVVSKGTTLAISFILQERLEHIARELGHKTWSEYARAILVKGVENDAELCGLMVSPETFKMLMKEFEENRAQLIKRNIRTLGAYIQFRLKQLSEPAKSVEA